MKFFIINLFSVFMFLFFGCGNGDPKVGDVITVDVTKSYPEKELILQDLFDIEYVPLETRDGFVTLGTVADIQIPEENQSERTKRGRIH